MMNGLFCNHNLVLWNCHRFKIIREVISGKPICYSSAEPSPQSVLLFKAFLKTTSNRDKFEKLSTDLRGVKKHKDA